MALLNYSTEGAVSRGSDWSLRLAEQGQDVVAQAVASELVVREGGVKYTTYGEVASAANAVANEHPPLPNVPLFVADTVGHVALMVQEMYRGAK